MGKAYSWLRVALWFGFGVVFWGWVWAAWNWLWVGSGLAQSCLKAGYGLVKVWLMVGFRSAYVRLTWVRLALGLV